MQSLCQGSNNYNYARISMRCKLPEMTMTIQNTEKEGLYIYFLINVSSTLNKISSDNFVSLENDFIYSLTCFFFNKHYKQIYVSKVLIRL